MNNTEMKLPLVTVIIPTYYDWERLQLCLDALAKQTYPKESLEILVVNNAPDDNAPSKLIAPENCILLKEAKPGSYAARNKALSIAKGEIYAFTDSDCLPKEDWIEKSVLFFNENPEYDRIGGNIKVFFKGLKPSVVEVYEKVFAFRQEEFVNEMMMAATGNMISKKEVFRAVGMFNESLMSGGDAEWGVRAARSGYKISYVPNIIVLHPARYKLSEIIQKTKREAGGHWHTSNSKQKISSLLLGFMPPTASIKKVLSNNSYSMSEKIISLGIRYFLRFIATIERLKLALGKKEERV